MRVDKPAAGLCVNADVSRYFPPSGEARAFFAMRPVLGLWVLLVNWEIVRWYVARLNDGGDEPWGVGALVLALMLTPKGLWRARISTRAILFTGVLALAAVVTAGVLPVLVRAGMVAGALGVLIAGGGGGVARTGLLALSLPVMATAQFYAGYPLRVVTAELGRPLLLFAGVATERAGVVLSWSGGEVIVDAPCSGVRMLWMGLVVACGLAAWRRLAWGRTVGVIAVALAGVIAANVVRAAILFLVESGVWPGAGWAHEMVGVVVFGGLLAGLWTLAERAGGVPRETSGAEGFALISRKTLWSLCGAGVFALGWSGVRVLERSRWDCACDQAPVIFAGWPETFEGKPLMPLARSSQQVKDFARGFPGETAVFREGERLVVLRWIREATRGVHPAADCYRARGYRVESRGIVKDAAGVKWSEFTAERTGESWRVRERWRDDACTDAWTDVSAWWWAVQREDTHGPWWAETVAVAEEPK